jgi:phosphoglycolate phosphatase
MTRNDIQLAVLDMAGTTVADDGLVTAAFDAATAAVGVMPGTPEAVNLNRHVRVTMGQSKIEVFRAIFDESTAQYANAEFEHAYAVLVDAGRARPLPGAVATIETLRANGVKIALTTGFGSITQQRLLSALGWHDLVDLVLSPQEAGRGRPHPDMVLTAVLRLRIDDVAAVAVVGDTASDIRTGRSAGASVVAGVLTGAHDEATLTAAGATHVLKSISELPALVLGEPSRQLTTP